jgi:tetratricopeptide (TPR) repeat protein
VIAACVLALFATQAPAAPAQDTSAPSAQTRVDRSAFLHRDPARLPRAAPDAWKGFDVAKFSEREVLEPIARARDAILRSDFLAALGELLDVLEKRPDFPPALHMGGVLYYRLQRYGDSATLLARYLEVAPERVGDTRVLGHDLYTLGRYAEARAHYERVLARAPKDVEALRGLALSLWRAGDAEAALAQLARALELAPRNDDLWSWKAAIAFDTGDDKSAREAAERAIGIDPFEARTWFTLARILDESGEEAPARSARARFEALSRTSAAVRHAEARLLLEPDSPARMSAWLEALTAHGAPLPIRQGLQRLTLTPRVARDPGVLRAELQACRALSDEERGRAAARDLEAVAGEDERSWRALLAWFEEYGDGDGARRARSHLGG